MDFLTALFSSHFRQNSLNNVFLPKIWKAWKLQFFYWEAEDAVVEKIFIGLETHCPPNINIVVCFFLPVLSEHGRDINPVL